MHWVISALVIATSPSLFREYALKGGPNLRVSRLVGHEQKSVQNCRDALFSRLSNSWSETLSRKYFFLV